MAPLGDILREEVTTQIDEVRQEGETAARERVAAAERKAAAQLEAHRKRMETDLKAAVRRARSAAEQTTGIARVQARQEMLAQVRRKALEELERSGQDDGYDARLEALAREAANVLGSAQMVVVHPDDEARLQAWADRKALSLETDAAVHLGVRLVDRDGRRSVENSLPERLRRVWEALAGEVAALLWP